MANSPSDSGDAPQGSALTQLVDADVERIAAAVADLLTARPQQPTDVRLTEYMSYVAPLPPPEWYDGYERVVPGAGHRILTMVEEEGKHRRWLDRSFAKYRLRGQILAFLVTMAVIASGVFLTHEGKKTYGFVLILANVVALTSLFIVREVRGNGNGS
jgi:uncharacterized membrane protein